MDRVSNINNSNNNKEVECQILCSNNNNNNTHNNNTNNNNTNNNSRDQINSCLMAGTLKLCNQKEWEIIMELRITWIKICNQ